jgi:hypothetical protein
MTGRTLCRLRVLVPLLALLATGCASGRYPVSGRVTYEDGTPVREGTVIGETTVDGKVVGVQGNIESDGSFTWGSDRPGDGAPPGTYKVLVMPRALGDLELAEGKRPAVAGKYTKFETSGHTVEVKAERNVFNVTVSPPKPKGN